MVNKINRYVGLSFLLIDDFIEFRHSLKNMIEAMGASNINLAGSGEEGIELYCQHQHDIILLDFNLGDGLNGLQMLEEMNFREILRKDTIVMLVTGETSMEMVQGAIDVRPDDYLPKPFTKAILKKRLDKAFEKNEALKPVFLALNKKDYLRAISCCDQLIVKQSKYALGCHRIKADCCLRLGKPNSAMAIYDSILEQRELSWALLGRARCKVHNSLYLEAISDFDRIIESQRFAVEAYDQKAESLLAIGDFENAYNVLQKAISISPNSVHRQRTTADLATRYQHFDTALASRRKVINLTRHLSHKLPEDYLKLAQLLSIIHGGNHGAQSRRAPVELAKLLKDMQSAFVDNIQMGIAAIIHLGIYDFMANQLKEGEIKIKAVFSRLKDLPDTLKPYLLDEIQFAKKICGDKDSIEQLYQTFYLANTADKQATDSHKANSFNQQGMSKFREKDFKSAYLSFKTAYINDQNNVNISLNLMQVIMKLINQGIFESQYGELLEMCSQTFRLITASDQRASHFKLLYNNIRAHIISNEMQQRHTNG
jgi:CheY-like chemotaxis protein